MFDKQKIEIKAEFPKVVAAPTREKKINISDVVKTSPKPLEVQPVTLSPSSSPVTVDIKSRKKTVISVGQALLISIDKLCETIKGNINSLSDKKEYSKRLEELRANPLFATSLEKKSKKILTVSPATIEELEDNLKKLSTLKYLYISGVNEISKDLIEEEIAKFQTTEYKVSKDFKVTNNEASRRYFETHLALETLRHNMGKVDLIKLFKTYSSIYDKLRGLDQQWFDKVDFGGHPSWLKTADDSESLDARKKISLREFDREKEFSELNKRALNYIVKIADAAGLLAKNNELIPLGEVFQEGYFEDFERGREFKDRDHHVLSNNLGILHSSMPTFLDDLARAATTYSYSKSTDRDRPVPAAKWVKDCAATWVQPFACSISGHYLGLLRVFLWLEKNKQFYFNDLKSFKIFSKCYAAILLAHGGGHSFYEFFAVLSLEKIRNAFRFMPGFNGLNMATMLLEDNEAAFDQALQRTLTYHNAQLTKAKLNQELTDFHVDSNLYSTLEQAVAASSLSGQAAYKIYTNPATAELIRSEVLTADGIINDANPVQIVETYALPQVKEAIKQQKLTIEELKKLAAMKAEGSDIDSFIAELLVLRQETLKDAGELIGVGVFHIDAFRAALDFLKEEGDTIFLNTYDSDLNKKNKIAVKRDADGYKLIFSEINIISVAGREEFAKEQVAQQVNTYLSPHETFTAIQMARKGLDEAKKPVMAVEQEQLSFSERYSILLPWNNALKNLSDKIDIADGLTHKFVLKICHQAQALSLMLKGRHSAIKQLYAPTVDFFQINDKHLVMLLLNGWANGKADLIMKGTSSQINQKLEAVMYNAFVEAEVNPLWVLGTILKKKPGGANWPSIAINLALATARAWWRMDEDEDEEENSHCAQFEVKKEKTLSQPQKDAQDLISFIENIYFTEALDSCVVLWEALRENGKQQHDSKEKISIHDENLVIAAIEERILNKAIDFKKPEVVKQVMVIKMKEGDIPFTSDNEIYKYAKKRGCDDIGNLLVPESQQAKTTLVSSTTTLLQPVTTPAMMTPGIGLFAYQGEDPPGVVTKVDQQTLDTAQSIQVKDAGHQLVHG